MLKVKVYLVDGSLMEFDKPDSIQADLRELRRSGLEGRELVHGLLTDDWGPPPSCVRIVGRTENGEDIDEFIDYD